MSVIGQLAVELGAPERSLRRAVETGMVRSKRLSARRIRLAEGERDYLRDHWGLLASLRQAMRTEPTVRTAILVGSVARGEDRAASDIDLLVERIDGNALDRMRLGMRLADKLGRQVDVASLEQAERDPLTLLQIIDEGRVIVDREGRWGSLRSRRPAVYKQATRAYRAQSRRTSKVLEGLGSP